MTPFRLAHVSDLHLPPPAGALGWRDLASKRLLSGLAWRRKGRQHTPEILGALVADVQAYAPDHIAITGDLTNFSTPREFAAARTWLEALGPAAGVTVSPGNHDALVGAGAEVRLETWREWLGDPPVGDFPHVRERGGVALINLCSAAPSALHLASGRLGEAQLERLAAVLASLADRGLFRVVMIHHPPVEGVVSGRKALQDGPALRDVLGTHGAGLILHGHAHEAVLGALPGPGGGAIPVIGVPSASAAPHGRHGGARWHAIEIDRAAGGTTIRVSARGFAPRSGAFAPLGAYVLNAPQRA